MSCREDSGAEFLTSHLEYEVPVVVDPTLLLNDKQWALISKNPKVGYKYILIYDLNGGEKLVKIANRIKDKTGYKIVCITSKVMAKYKVDKIVFNAGPSEFVGWFENAEFTVTDSFHGTSFSLIFKKAFYTYIAIPNLATRIMNLLTIANQKNRIISDDNIDNFVFDNYDGYNLDQLYEKIRQSKFLLLNTLK